MVDITNRKFYTYLACGALGCLPIALTVPNQASQEGREQLKKNVQNGIEWTGDQLFQCWTGTKRINSEIQRKSLSFTARNTAEKEWNWATGTGKGLEWLEQRKINFKEYMKSLCVGDPSSNLTENEFLKGVYLDKAELRFHKANSDSSRSGLHRPIDIVGIDGYLGLNHLEVLQEFEAKLGNAEREAMAKYIEENPGENKLYPKISPERLRAPDTISKQLIAESVENNPQITVPEKVRLLLQLGDHFKTLTVKMGEKAYVEKLAIQAASQEISLNK